ncbi:MAG: Uma2 family endonuclease [Phormidesmis sp.]
MVADFQSQLMSVEEYLEWEPQQECRYEYCAGRVFAMAGGTKNHDKLSFNLRRALSDTVEAQGCDMTGSDVKVLVEQGQSYRYPDLVVSCDERDQSNDTFYRYPKLIVEVLSAGTEAVDRIDKFKEYIQIPTLQEYLLISTEEMKLECYRRGEGRLWLYSPYYPGESIILESVGVELSIELIYRNIQIPLST